MARRRKKGGVKRRTRNINIPIVDTAAGIMLVQSAFGVSGLDNLKKGKIMDGLNAAAARLKQAPIQQHIIKTIAGAAIIKIAGKSLRMNRIGSIGPIKLNVR